MRPSYGATHRPLNRPSAMPSIVEQEPRALGEGLSFDTAKGRGGLGGGNVCVVEIDQVPDFWWDGFSEVGGGIKGCLSKVCDSCITDELPWKSVCCCGSLEAILEKNQSLVLVLNYPSKKSLIFISQC